MVLGDYAAYLIWFWSSEKILKIIGARDQCGFMSPVTGAREEQGGAVTVVCHNGVTALRGLALFAFLNCFVMDVQLAFQRFAFAFCRKGAVTPSCQALPRDRRPKKRELRVPVRVTCNGKETLPGNGNVWTWNANWRYMDRRDYHAVRQLWSEPGRKAARNTPLFPAV